jgi:hypothetical protein
MGAGRHGERHHSQHVELRGVTRLPDIQTDFSRGIRDGWIARGAQHFRLCEESTFSVHRYAGTSSDATSSTERRLRPDVDDPERRRYE